MCRLGVLRSLSISPFTATSFGMSERSDEATAGGIDVYRDVMSSLLLELVEDVAYLFHRFIMTGICRSQDHENAYASMLA